MSLTLNDQGPLQKALHSPIISWYTNILYMCFLALWCGRVVCFTLFILGKEEKIVIECFLIFFGMILIYFWVFARLYGYMELITLGSGKNRSETFSVLRNRKLCLQCVLIFMIWVGKWKRHFMSTFIRLYCNFISVLVFSRYDFATGGLAYI